MDSQAHSGLHTRAIPAAPAAAIAPVHSVYGAGSSYRDMVTSASGRPTSPCRAGSLLLAGLFVAFAATQAPHLVHHFFEPDLVQDECPFASSGEHTSGLQVEPVAVVATPDVRTPALPAAPVAARSVVLTASPGRGPPLHVS